MHSSKAMLTAERKHPAAQATWLHSTNAAKLAAASAQPQQQAQQQPAPAPAPAPAAAAPTPAASAPAVEGQTAERAALKGSTGSPEQRAASAGSQDNDDGDDDMGAEDWNDILAVWMQAVGMPQFVADSTSGSSFDGQSEPGERREPATKSAPGCALHAHSCHAVELQCA